jgi:hypothetical protein
MKHFLNILEIHPFSVRSGLEEMVGHTHLSQDNDPNNLSYVARFTYGQYKGCQLELCYGRSEHFCQLSMEGTGTDIKVVLEDLKQTYLALLSKDPLALECSGLGLPAKKK